MAKKLATHFRAVKVGKTDKDGNPESYERVHLKPGDDPSELPKETQKQLEELGVLVDEKRLSADGTVRIPYGEPDREVETTPTAAKSTPNQTDKGGDK